MGLFSPIFDTLTLIKTLWDSGFDAVTFIQGSFNAWLPRLSTYALLFVLPPYLAFKSIRYILKSLLWKDDLSGKIVLITGASSGIGEHLAYAYAKRGSCLVIAARRERSLEQVAENARFLGSPHVVPVTADVSKVEDCQRLIHTAIQHFGRLDHVVNCAGVTTLGLFEDLQDVSRLAPAMDINFWGSVYTAYYAIPHLKRSRGKIIQIASSNSWLNAPRMSFYNASKAAVVSFFETLRVELGSEVHILIVTPGLIESEIGKGKYLMPDGQIAVDQEMRDVQTSVIPVERVERCAEDIVKSASRGDRSLSTPSWMRSFFFYKTLCPEVVDWINRQLMFPRTGRPATESPSKTILDITGLKSLLYPPSILSPRIKTDFDASCPKVVYGICLMS